MSQAMISEGLNGTHWDAVILGAGMSGLAAGIRLAMFDKKVLILERHNAAGGLNSFYSIAGRKYDVGLHAMTNFVRPGVKGAPLTKLLRQLRIKRDDWDLCEQKGSSICFGNVRLRFSNDFELLQSEVAAAFPKSIDAFERLVSAVREFDDVALGNKPMSARDVLKSYIDDPRLVEALLLPIFYYGSAQENDIDWSQFVIMFKALYLEGFARPFDGVRVVIKTLLDRYRELGGKRKMKCGVSKMLAENGRVTHLELDSGDVITADNVISSAGYVETLKLLGEHKDDQVGRLSFVESMSVFDRAPEDFGWDDTILFFNAGDTFHYEQPSGLVDVRSGVICLPNNYEYGERSLNEGWLRVTALANYKMWAGLEEGVYREEKKKWFAAMQKEALRILPGNVSAETLKAHTLAEDMFTPRTITKYTGHMGGAIYGAPEKVRDGRTDYENLFVCGTDQGFLGIVGAMLSGISMANLHALS